MAAELTQKEEAPQQLLTVSQVRTGGTKPPLFLVHGIGGTVLGLGRMLQYLAPGRPVYAVQSPPLDGSVPPPSSLEEMAARYVYEVRRVQPEGPYHFLGYSLGGLIAFEMAQNLTRAGQTVGLLAMLDTFQLEYWHKMSRSFSGRIGRFKREMGIHTKALLFGSKRLGYIGDRLRSKTAMFFLSRLGNTQPAVANKFASIDNVNGAAARKYRVRPYSGSLALLRATERDDKGDYLLGWGGLAQGGIEVFDIPGRHETINQEPNVQILAAKLEFLLEKAALIENLRRSGS
jgi:thioesterase domain-containing protein